MVACATRYATKKQCEHQPEAHYRFKRSLANVPRGGVLCVERRCSRIGSCGCLAYTNVLEDRGDDIGIFDAGDDAQRATALGAGLDVDGDDAFQALHPSHGGKGLIRFFVARFAFWHDALAMLAIRREHAVGPGEVQLRTRNQSRQAGDEVEWLEDDVGGAVAKRLLEPMIDDLSSLIDREPHPETASYSAEVAAVVSYNPDIVINLGFSSDGSETVRQLIESGVGPER